jgi:hypothetical protein
MAATAMQSQQQLVSGIKCCITTEKGVPGIFHVADLADQVLGMPVTRTEYLRERYAKASVRNTLVAKKIIAILQLIKKS